WSTAHAHRGRSTQDRPATGRSFPLQPAWRPLVNLLLAAEPDSNTPLLHRDLPVTQVKTTTGPQSDTPAHTERSNVGTVAGAIVLAVGCGSGGPANPRSRHGEPPLAPTRLEGPSLEAQAQASDEAEPR